MGDAIKMFDMAMVNWMMLLRCLWQVPSSVSYVIKMFLTSRLLMGDVIMMLQVPSTVDDVIKMFVTVPEQRGYRADW